MAVRPTDGDARDGSGGPPEPASAVARPAGVHPALARHTGFLLSRAGMTAQRQFAPRLERLGLTLRMWGALNVLAAEDGITQQRLGGSAGIDPSSMVGTIDELEARGLVERGAHPSDRRAHALHLTDAGHRTLAEGRRLASDAQDELLGGLDADEREQLHSLLLRVVAGSSAAERCGPAD